MKKNFESLVVGNSDSFFKKFNLDELNKFSEISGDINPLHTSKKFAVNMGFKGNVLHGLLTSSLYSTLVGVYLVGDYALIHSVQIIFSQPAYLDLSYKTTGKIVHINKTQKQFEIHAKITDPEDLIISKAKIYCGYTNE